MKYYIGIDGGGTKTEGVLTDRDGRILARVFGTASNPNDVTPDGSARVLISLTEKLLTESGLSESDLPEISLFGGIAGGINHGATLEDALMARFPTVGALQVRSDVQILLSGELPVGDGACIICGTGSACFVRRGEEIIRIGGWGYLLDSGGSGYDMGRDTLEAVLRAHDGRGKATALTDMVTAKLGGEAHTRISEIYAGGKPFIASFAPLAFDAAEAGDEVATDILRHSARALAEYIEAAWNCLSEKGDPPTCLPVVMGGGISERCTWWPMMVASLTDDSIPLRISVATARPVFGAVAEAAKAAGETHFDTLRAGFTASYGQLA